MAKIRLYSADMSRRDVLQHVAADSRGRGRGFGRDRQRVRRQAEKEPG